MAQGEQRSAVERERDNLRAGLQLLLSAHLLNRGSGAIRQRATHAKRRGDVHGDLEVTTS